MKKNQISRAVIGALGLLAIGANSLAADFKLEDGAEVTWKNSLSLGQMRRNGERDPKLLNAKNATPMGISGATGGNVDDADLNYANGDTFSTLANLSSEVKYKKGTFAGVLGVRAWKDTTLENGNVLHGSFVNGYIPNTPLKDTGFETYAKFSNIALMNAYLQDSYDVAAGKLTTTLGRHVLNWGSGMFVQGINQINAIDFNAIRQPGLERSDWQLPQGMISAKLDLKSGQSLEAFYQFEYQNSVFPGCGTYFLGSDATVGPNANNACAAGVLSPGANGDITGLNAKTYIPATATRMPNRWGQFGIGWNIPSQAIAGKIGIYALHIASRTPIVSFARGDVPFLYQATGGKTSGSVYWEYPEGVNILGVSTQSKIADWNIGSEFTITPNAPVQISPGDLVGAFVYNQGPLVGRYAAVPMGGDLRGYDRLRKIQFQINASKAFPDVAGANLMVVAAEAAGQWVNIPDGTNPVRYGRAFVFGVANAPSYASCLNGNPAYCVNDGFVTSSSWGVRARGQLVYNNVWGTGITLKPTLTVTADVSGYSADGQFNSGRGSYQVGLIGEINKTTTLSLNSTMFKRNAAWDPLRDRDYIAAALKVSF